VLPSLAAPILIIATLQISSLIFAEAALGYLGFGVPPPTPTLGGMIADGQGVMTTGLWWPVLVPGLAIVLVIGTTTILGDWLRDRLDPHTGR
jgi:peptide/nickel transport system permease protein